MLRLSHIVAVLVGMCVFSEQVQRHQRDKPRPAGASKATSKFLPLSIWVAGGTKQAQMDIRNWVVVTFPIRKQRAISLDLRWAHTRTVNVSGSEDAIPTLARVLLLCLHSILPFYTSPSSQQSFIHSLCLRAVRNWGGSESQVVNGWFERKNICTSGSVLCPIDKRHLPLAIYVDLPPIACLLKAEVTDSSDFERGEAFG